MPGPRVLQSVTANITGFGEKIAAFIIDPARAEAVLKALQTVKMQYSDGVWARLSALFGYRVRAADISGAAERLDAVKDTPLIRLQAFLEVFREGGWETTSVNTTLVVALAKCMPEYQPLTVEAVTNSQNDFRTVLVNQLQASIREQKLFKARVSEERSSLQASISASKHQEARASLSAALTSRDAKTRFCDSAEVAKEQAVRYPEVWIVHKETPKNGSYALTWYTASGGAVSLPPFKLPTASTSASSSSSSSSSSAAVLNELSPQVLAAYATHSIESLLEATVLQVNPATDEPLSAPALFILSGEGENARLVWRDSIGGQREITLSSEAQEWLKAHPKLNEREQAIFKSFLMTVDTRGEPVCAARRALAENVVARSQGGIPLILVGSMEKISRLHQRDGYHFLTRSVVNGIPGRWELYVRVDGAFRLLHRTHEGASSPVAESTPWNAFDEVLAGLENCLPREVSRESFKKLRNAIPEGEQRAQPVHSVCYVVEDFNEHTPHDFPPKTFIVGMARNLYCATHERTPTGARQVVRLDWSQCPEAQAVVASWTPDGRISDAMLTQLKVALEGFEPAQCTPKTTGRINLEKFAGVTAHFGHRRADRELPGRLMPDDERFSAVRKVLLERAISTINRPVPGTLQINTNPKYSSVLRLFGKRAASVPSMAEPAPAASEDPQNPQVMG
ncbi:hypothetical protein Lgee_0840 [Legionella geestiana]|uniref:Uncharacterized protein n=1 Tax=Legionella geestiana TaxID=45065 RepID=A0A0W0U0G5_9GAMM|nr:hypothetical protein [Legionella geestiana]KTD01571.1 hypothetical protein Lgee_0840 [Legionella geestiana]QBS11877.1 hypothetical protein E4T54_03445 [Legionella geestiana]QDQ40511.1 hypothetical protein E3226_008980 [Legionella geestiana]STX53421.1 Uncharacterised protein [Legionella geestiana]